MKKYFLLLGACILLGSCSTGDAGSSASVLERGSQALTFLNYRAVSENEIEFEFSQPVKLTALNFEPELTVASVTDGSTVSVVFEENLSPGALLAADLLAEDDNKNTINVLISFRARNNRMPSLVINEIRTENSNTNGKSKPEFIEFKTLSAGNLGAMRIVIHGNGTSNASKKTVYEFQPVEVGKDEYIVLHLRTVEDGCIDEYGALDESGGTDSSPTGRDFWLPGNSKLIHEAATAIYVLDQDDNALAGVMLSDSSDDRWKKDYLVEAAEFLHKQGAWTAADGSICTPADAVNSTGTTNTRTICRDEEQENNNTATNWYIVATSNATPGKTNSSKRYVP